MWVSLYIKRECNYQQVLEPDYFTEELKRVRFIFHAMRIRIINEKFLEECNLKYFTPKLCNQDVTGIKNTL
jgi:hypothetical protein